MLSGLIKTSNEFEDEHSGTPLKAPKNPYFKIACEHNNPMRKKVQIVKFGMPNGLIKTSDEFEDQHSGTTVKALKSLTSKNL